MKNTSNTDFSEFVLNGMVSPIVEAMPLNAVWVGETYDFDKREELPTVTVFGNHALGCRLSIEVAKIIGRLPERVSKSTADVLPLARIAAGLPVENDDWYDGFVFMGEDEIRALSVVFIQRDFHVASSTRSNYIFDGRA